MTRNVGTARINDVREIPLRNKLLDELLAKFAFHERIGRDHSHIACGFLSFAIACQREIEEAFHEWRGE